MKLYIINIYGMMKEWCHTLMRVVCASISSFLSSFLKGSTRPNISAYSTYKMQQKMFHPYLICTSTLLLIYLRNSPFNQRTTSLTGSICFLKTVIWTFQVLWIHDASLFLPIKYTNESLQRMTGKVNNKLTGYLQY